MTLSEKIEDIKVKYSFIEITDMEEANIFLKNTSYRRIKHFIRLTKKKNINNKINFSQIIELYLLDKKLRNNLLLIIESFELSLKVRIVEIFLELGCNLFEEENFTFKIDENGVNEFIEFIDKIKSKKDIVKYCKKNKIKFEEVPIEICMEYLTFGELCKLIDNMKKKDLRKLCKIYDGFNHEQIKNTISSIKHLRNLCSHNALIYGKNIVFKTPPFPSYLLKNEKELKRKKCLFRFLIVMKPLLVSKNKIWQEFLKRIENISKNANAELDNIGLVPGWKTLLK